MADWKTWTPSEERLSGWVSGQATSLERASSLRGTCAGEASFELWVSEVLCVSCVLPTTSQLLCSQDHLGLCLGEGGCGVDTEFFSGKDSSPSLNHCCF